MASIIQVGRKWRAQVRRRGHPTQTRTFSTKALAERWARQVESDIERGEFKDARDLKKTTINDLIKRYRVEQTKDIGRSKAHCLLQIERRIGDTRLSDLSVDLLINYARNRGAGPVTWGMEFAYLGKILRVAKVVWGYPIQGELTNEARTALDMLGLSGRSKERTRRPTQDELDRLCEHFRSKTRQKIPMWDIIPFAVATAMRLGEIVSIRWDDINEKDKTVVIRDRKDPKEKKGNNQVVPLLPAAWEIVQRQPKTDERIFPYSAKSIPSIFPRACQELGIVDLRFHDLRHEGTSRLFEMGYQIQEVAIFTGHRDWNQLRRYTQIRPKSLHRDAVKRFSR